jgi:hypothetical protein
MKIHKLYLRGIGIGLVISWVTGALSYLHSGSSVFTLNIELGFVLSIIFLILSFFVKD